GTTNSSNNRSRPHFLCQISSAPYIHYYNTVIHRSSILYPFYTRTLSGTHLRYNTKINITSSSSQPLSVTRTQRQVYIYCESVPSFPTCNLRLKSYETLQPTVN